MPRSSSRLAQALFDFSLRLRSLHHHRSRVVKLIARVSSLVVGLLARRIGTKRTVVATVYGRALTVPAEHPLPATLIDFPQSNRPLALAVQAIASLYPSRSKLALVDVGANIGDTAAILEQALPGRCSYLCIEPDRELASILRSNYPDSERFQMEFCFIGEEEGRAVSLVDDGRANPTTKLIEETEQGGQTNAGQLVRLDRIALPFAKKNGGIDLIKVDTEGYDFSVLRSSPQVLDQYRPSLFIEWYPGLMPGGPEEALSGFDYLKGFGYDEMVFFNHLGDFHCRISHPDRLFLRGLAAVTYNRTHPFIPYFDVFLSTSAALCDELVELNIRLLAPQV